jgi:hypothetical protein
MPSRRPMHPTGGSKIAPLLHQRAAEAPRAWEIKGEELARAAEILWTQHEGDFPPAVVPALVDGFVSPLLPTAYMLAALAAENYLKGKLIAIRPALRADGTFAHKTHRLLDLVEQVGITLDADEHDFIERLEVFGTWAGRYPIPLNPDDMRPRQNPDGGFGVLNYATSLDRPIWRRVLMKLTAP